MTTFQITLKALEQTRINLVRAQNASNYSLDTIEMYERQLNALKMELIKLITDDMY